MRVVRRHRRCPPRGCREDGAQRVHGRVDALLRDFTAQNGCGVQMRERRGRRGVGQVVRGDVDRLHGGDGAVLRGGDAAPAARPSRWPASAGSRRRRACGPSSVETSLPACTKRKMLSMKSSTSLCSYVAEILGHRQARTAPRAYARRADSFIWPKTSAVLSETPLSRISRQRSLPSRLRSPTPVKME